MKFVTNAQSRKFKVYIKVPDVHWNFKVTV